MAWIGLARNERDPQTINEAVRQLGQGRSSAVGTVTLRANQTTTTVVAPTCTANSGVYLSPITADAANDGATNWFTPSKGQFIVNHASNARVDRTYNWAVVG